jgi:hypothetical protein
MVTDTCPQPLSSTNDDYLGLARVRADFVHIIAYFGSFACQSTWTTGFIVAGLNCWRWCLKLIRHAGIGLQA